MKFALFFFNFLILLFQGYVNGRGQDDIDMLVSAKTGGATPLLIACRNGHYDIVQYLLKRCQANVEQTGSVIFDGETIEGAPPLWVAGAAGHTNIVKLLIRHSANVNSTTKTNSTPLRAACFDGHYEIVKFLVMHGAGKGSPLFVCEFFRTLKENFFYRY